VLAKLDYRFPETESVKFHQLLDPEMKDLLPRQEASRVLEDAINVAYARRFISGAAPQLHVSVPSCSETVNSVVLGCSGSFQLFDVNTSTL